MQIYPKEIVEVGDGDMSSSREWSINKITIKTIFASAHHDGGHVQNIDDMWLLFFPK